MRLGVRGVGHEVVLEGDVEGRVVVGPPFGDLEVGVVGDLEEGESRREVDVEVEAVGALTVFGLDLRGSHAVSRGPDLGGRRHALSVDVSSSSQRSDEDDRPQALRRASHLEVGVEFKVSSARRRTRTVVSS